MGNRPLGQGKTPYPEKGKRMGSCRFQTKQFAPKRLNTNLIEMPKIKNSHRFFSYRYGKLKL